MVSLISLGLSAGALAQDDQPRHHGKEANRIVQLLEVTDDQLPAFQSISKEYAEKRRELHQQHKQQLEVLKAEQKEALSGILNVEQIEKLDQLKQRRHGNWKDGKRPFSEKRTKGDRK